MFSTALSDGTHEDPEQLKVSTKEVLAGMKDEFDALHELVFIKNKNSLKPRLYTRQDQNADRDVGLQEGLYQMLYNYDPDWLRLALKATLGKEPPLLKEDNKNKKPEMDKPLKRFIREHLLSDKKNFGQAHDKTPVL